MASGALAPCITRSSAVMVLTMKNKQVISLHEEGLKNSAISVLVNNRKEKKNPFPKK